MNQPGTQLAVAVKADGIGTATTLLDAAIVQTATVDLAP